MSGDAPLRLFFGLPLPGGAARTLVRWQQAALAGVHGVRPVPPEFLHVTLAFLGRCPADAVPALRVALRETARRAERPMLTPVRYRETQRVAMIVLADDGSRAAEFQGRLSAALEQLGLYRPEKRAWLPHVTVARLRSRPGLRPQLPAIGAFSPSDAALYHSVLRPDGARYSIVEAVALGG